MDKIHKNSDGWTGMDRRSRTREATRRRAVCARPGVDDVLADGMVINISPNGLGIRTPVPLAEGDPIEIEVYPRDESARSNVILVRGRVARVAPDGGEYIMGVHLGGRHGAHAGPAATTSFSAEAQEMLARLPRQLRDRAPDAPSPFAYAEHRAGEAETPVVFRRARRRWKAWLASLLLALLLLLLLAGVAVWWLYSFPAVRDWFGTPQYGLATRSTGEAPPAPVQAKLNETPLPPEDLRPLARADRLGALRLAQAQNLLLSGQVASAHAAFHEVAEDAARDPLSRFVAHLGVAWSLALMDRRQDAAEAVNTALAREKSNEAMAIPGPWIGVAESMQDDLAQGDPPWTALGFLVDALVIGELRAPDEASDKAAAPAEETEGTIEIEVSTSQYLLTVRRGNLVLGRFPIGLGQDGATPRGDFALANKIRDPAWYNRGDVVPPGDPENPLGALWMGLGDDNGPTPIGIHPTDDPNSIGGNESRGCIRMRPDDAERIFRWCPVGTPVRVRP